MIQITHRVFPISDDVDPMSKYLKSTSLSTGGASYLKSRDNATPDGGASNSPSLQTAMEAGQRSAQTNARYTEQDHQLFDALMLFAPTQARTRNATEHGQPPTQTYTDKEIELFEQIVAGQTSGQRRTA